MQLSEKYQKTISHKNRGSLLMLYWSLSRPILVCWGTYIGLLSDQYSFPQEAI